MAIYTIYTGKPGRQQARPTALTSSRTGLVQTQAANTHRSMLGLHLVLNLFNRLEVLDSLDPQLVGRILAVDQPVLTPVGKINSLAHNQCPRMRLQSTRRHHVVHSVLNHLAQCQRLVLPSHHKHHLSCIHHRLHANRQGHAGHRREVVVEETAVVEDGLVCECLDPGTRRE